MRNTMIKKLLLNGGKWQTVQGVPPLTLEKSLGKDLRDYKIYGNSIQDGTPTPDTPVEVESVGEYDETTGKYKIPVVARGINLIPYPYTNTTKEHNGVTFIANSDGSVKVFGTATGDAYFMLTTNAQFGDTNINAIAREVNSNGKYTVSKRLFYNKSQNNLSISIVKGTVLDETLYPMLVAGVYTAETMPKYEPYQEPIETNIYLDEPLRKIGDYADYIDFENGVVVRNIKRTELTGSAIRYNWNGRNGVYFLHMLDDNYNMNKNAVSNRCIHWTSHPAYDTNNIVMWLGMGNKVVYWVGILDCLGFTTTTELDNWLAENLTYVYYATNTPTETQMELPKLPTLKGTTVITVNTSVAPSNMLVRYKRKS